MNEFERANLLEKIVFRCLYLLDECPIAGLLRLMNDCGMGFVQHWGREYQRDEVVNVLESLKSRGFATTGIGLDFCTRDFINDDEVCYLLTDEGNERASKLELPDISSEILAARQQKEAEHEARKHDPVLERELPDFVLYILRCNTWMYPEDFVEATNFVYSRWRDAGGYTVLQEEMGSIIAALISKGLLRRGEGFEVFDNEGLARMKPWRDCMNPIDEQPGYTLYFISERGKGWAKLWNSVEWPQLIPRISR